MPIPQLPALLLDFMASRRAGMHLRCEDFHPHKQPPDCRDAYSDVVWWSTSTSFFTNSVLTFLMVSTFSWPDVLCCSAAMPPAPVFSLACMQFSCMH